MQIKATIRYHFTLIKTATIKTKIKTKDLKITSTGKDAESSYPAGGNVKWCSHFGKQSGSSSKSEGVAHALVILNVGVCMHICT